MRMSASFILFGYYKSLLNEILRNNVRRNYRDHVTIRYKRYASNHFSRFIDPTDSTISCIFGKIESNKVFLPFNLIYFVFTVWKCTYI